MREAQALLERAEKYINSCRLLIDAEDFESAVSRAYYAMFYAAEAVLLSRGLSFSSHRGVISSFGEHFVKTGKFQKEMGRELNRAFEMRQLGDYEYTFVISREEAEMLLTAAEQFVKQVTDYVDESTST